MKNHKASRDLLVSNRVGICTTISLDVRSVRKRKHAAGVRQRAQLEYLHLENVEVAVTDQGSLAIYSRPAN